MARPRSPLISRETAVRAGLEVIDELGLDAFSLPLLAKKLSVKAPSLYHHFRDKSAVLAEIARQIMLDADEPRRLPTDDWQEAVVSLSISAHRSILRHPNAAPLLLLYPPRHVVLSGYERTLRKFEKRGVPPELRMLISVGLDNILMGFALTAAYSRSKGLPPFPVYDPAAFPSFAAAVKANPFDEEQLFVATVRAFLAGVTNPATALLPADPAS
jgi:TetR/AcrR family tetracycline transcriptional repressor